MMRFQRRQRTTFSKQQLEAMKAAFEQNNYPEARFRNQLSKAINLDAMRIQVWFQNQRAKNKKRQGLVGSLDDDDSRSPPPPTTTTRQAQFARVQLIQDHQHQQQQHQQLKHQLVHNNNNHQQICQTSAGVPSRLDGGQQASGFFRLRNHEDDKEDNDDGADMSPESVGPPSPDQQPGEGAVCVFNSVTANEAALAVSGGEFESIVDYHRNKYGNHHHDHRRLVFLNSSRRQCSSPVSSTASPQSTNSPPMTTTTSPPGETNQHHHSRLHTPSTPSHRRSQIAAAYHQDEMPQLFMSNPNNNSLASQQQQRKQSQGVVASCKLRANGAKHLDKQTIANNI